LEFTRWSLKSWSFSGTLIQAQLHLVELRLSDGSKVGSSREVLPQEQIGVFVRATLPGTLWIAEVDLHIDLAPLLTSSVTAMRRPIRIAVAE
jgi:hypothetical protein